MRRAFLAFTFAALLALAAGCSGPAGGAEVLRVGLIPNQNPEEVEAQYEPLQEYLSAKLGREVELSVPTSYPAVVEAMASGRLDLAHFGGLTYVQARERTAVTPLVTEINPYTGTTKYHSLIIVPSGSDIQRVSELKGKTFAFGSVSSTSGSLYPAIMLREAGIDYRKDLREKIYTGGHDATAQAVANGRVDGGGIEDRILYDLEKEGVIDKGSVRVIKKSAPIEGYPWAARGDLPEKLKNDITQAFLSMDDPKLLDLMRAEGYERVRPSDYDYVEEQARELGLLTGQE